MKASPNQSIYRWYAPVYDLLFGCILAGARRRAVRLLELQPGERLLVPGAGTGLDLPLLVESQASITAFDISPEMLIQAKRKAGGRSSLLRMNAQQLTFPDGCFDVALLALILSVAPDGRAVLEETWRVLRPGGRLVIFDKFLPPQSRLTLPRRILGRLIRALGTDPNRSLESMLSGLPGLEVVCNQPDLLQGQYRLVKIYKQHG
jgi:phosphatidylethanolamine/phosphatidyl-N-methylethanolamine N-methyltransferase